MDLLTHIFLPLIALYSVKKKIKLSILPLAFFGIFPDFDVFIGIHRSLFHSLLFLIPLLVILYSIEKNSRNEGEYSGIIAFFLLSHIFLDFLSGGVPFLYPAVETGIGLEFPAKVGFGSGFYFQDLLPVLVFTTPESVHGKVFEIFSGFGVASFIVFCLIFVSRQKI